jgi:hypothetical protein
MSAYRPISRPQKLAAHPALPARGGDNACAFTTTTRG